MLSRLANGYLKMVRKYPWRIASLTAAVLASTGDISSQQIVEKRGFQNHDFRRTLKMFTIGAMVGPCLRTWLLLLDKLVVGSTALHVAKKLAFDQFIWAPTIISTWFVLSDKFDGKSNEEMIEHYKRDFLKVLKVGYFIWPNVQFFNLYFVPFEYRILVLNFVGVFWSTFLCWMLNKENEELENEKLEIGKHEIEKQID